jgi:hypothetical protein
MSEFSRQHESRSLALENRRPARCPYSCTRISRSSRAVFIEPLALDVQTGEYELDEDD